MDGLVKRPLLLVQTFSHGTMGVGCIAFISKTSLKASMKLTALFGMLLAASVSSPAVAADSDCRVLANTFQELLALTNEARQEQGLGPLTFSASLGQAAQGHAADMARHGYFAHEGRNGSTVGSRIAAKGYDYRAIAENIAAGYNSPEAVVEGWLSSPGHRQNLLNPDYTEIGFGLEFNPNTPYGFYWVQNFGQPAGGESGGGVYVPSQCEPGPVR